MPIAVLSVARSLWAEGPCKRVGSVQWPGDADTAAQHIVDYFVDDQEASSIVNKGGINIRKRGKRFSLYLTYMDGRSGIPSNAFLIKWGNLSLLHHPFDFGSETIQVLLIRSVLVAQDLLGQIGVVPVTPAGVFQKPGFIQRNTHKVKVVFYIGPAGSAPGGTAGDIEDLSFGPFFLYGRTERGHHIIPVNELNPLVGHERPDLRGHLD